MRNSEDLFRRHQILRDQLSELVLLRRQVSLAEKRIQDLSEKATSSIKPATDKLAVTAHQQTNMRVTLVSQELL